MQGYSDITNAKGGFEETDEINQLTQTNPYENKKFKKDAITLGIDADTGEIIRYLPPEGANFNMECDGSSGSGKSSTRVLLDLLEDVEFGRSSIVIDVKGAICDQTYNYVRKKIKKNGGAVKILNLRPGYIKNSDGFNPLVSIAKKPEVAEELTDRVANLILDDTGDMEKDTYWHPNNVNLLKCLQLLISTNPEYIKSGLNNIPEIVNILNEYNDLTKLRNFVKTMSSSCGELANTIKKCFNIFESAGEKNCGLIINGLAMRLQVFTNKNIGKVLSHDEINLTLPQKKQCVYYIILPETASPYRKIAGLFFSLMVSEQCDYALKCKRKEKEWLTVRYIMDEYYASGGIANLPEILGVVRSYHIWIEYFLQTRGQLVEMYGERGATIARGNVHTQCLLSANDPDTQREWEEKLGMQSVLVESTAINQSTTALVKLRDTDRKNYVEKDVPVLSSGEIGDGTLKSSEVVWKMANHQPLILTKYFAELKGEAISPLYAKCLKYGAYDSSRHCPKWRKKKK